MRDTQPARMNDELRTHLTRAFGFDNPPATLDAFWRKMIRTFTDALGRSVTINDLCTTDQSPHWAVVDDETQYYQCVTDALLLGGYLDETVTVRTVSPLAERELVLRFDADGSISAPDGSLLSFGVKQTVSAPEGPVTPEAMYGRLCPYTKAFASRKEYEQWVAANPDVVSDVHLLDESMRLFKDLLSAAQSRSETDSTSTSADDSCSC